MKLQAFFNKLFWPVYTARNIVLVWGFGFILLAVGAVINWTVYGTVRPDFDFKTMAIGDWFTTIGALAWCTVFLMWTIRGIFGAPNPIDNGPTTRSLQLQAALPEYTYLQRLKNKLVAFVDRQSAPKVVSNVLALSIVSLFLGFLFDGFFDFMNLGALLAFYGFSLKMYREFWFDLEI